MTVNLAPTADATQRTRNRIKEHGPAFKYIKWGRHAFGDGQWWLFKAKDGWLGWLREGEFKTVAPLDQSNPSGKLDGTPARIVCGNQLYS